MKKPARQRNSHPLRVKSLDSSMADARRRVEQSQKAVQQLRERLAERYGSLYCESILERIVEGREPFSEEPSTAQCDLLMRERGWVPHPIGNNPDGRFVTMVRRENLSPRFVISTLALISDVAKKPTTVSEMAEECGVPEARLRRQFGNLGDAGMLQIKDRLTGSGKRGMPQNLWQPGPEGKKVLKELRLNKPKDELSPSLDRIYPEIRNRYRHTTLLMLSILDAVSIGFRTVSSVSRELGILRSVIERCMADQERKGIYTVDRRGTIKVTKNGNKLLSLGYRI